MNKLFYGAAVMALAIGVSGQSMLEGVQRRRGLALGRFRPAELSVLPICFRFPFGHRDLFRLDGKGVRRENGCG